MGEKKNKQEKNSFFLPNFFTKTAQNNFWNNPFKQSCISCFGLKTHNVLLISIRKILYVFLRITDRYA